jgi:hypothetical protein
MANARTLMEQAKAHLLAGEQVLAFVQGVYEARFGGNKTVRNGVMIATTHRLVMFGKRLGGFDLESFPYENISSFEQGRGFSGGKVKFFASGNEVHFKWIRDHDSLARVVEIVLGRMGKQPSSGIPHQVAVPQQATVDPYEQLRRLGELRDAGVLTPQEFEAKKAEVLARI